MCEVDPRHVEVLLKQFRSDTFRPVATPIAKDELGEDQHKESEKLEADGIARYKFVVARANHLAVERPDAQLACKELSANTSEPRMRDWEEFSRLGCHPKGRLRMVHRYLKNRGMSTLIAFTDANWAGDTRI